MFQCSMFHALLSPVLVYLFDFGTCLYVLRVTGVEDEEIEIDIICKINRNNRELLKSCSQKHKKNYFLFLQ